VQEKYGQTREQAEQEVERRLSEYRGAGSNLKSKMDEFGAAVSSRAGEAAGAVSSGMQSARSYFQDQNFEDVSEDIAGWVRRFPIQAILISIGLGYLLARGLSRSSHRSYLDPGDTRE
jgi:hypothetical protein